MPRMFTPVPQDQPLGYYSNWSPYWTGPGIPGVPFPHSPQTRLTSPDPPTEAHHNRAPLPEEEVTLRQILTTKRNLATHIDGLIKEASDSSNALEAPYHELKSQYESAEASYVAGQQYMMELVRVRRSMQPSLDYIKSLLHPIRRYPSDILSLVFIATVESEKLYDSSLEIDNTNIVTRYKKRHAALDISHVCRAWRALAHATPEMWSTVRLSLSRRSGAAHKLALFARHAKAIPLNVVIHHLQPSYFPTYASMDSDDEDAVAPLFDSVNRLRSLEVHFSHFRALTCLHKLGMSKLDQLEELSLRSDPVILPTTPEFSLTAYLSTAQNLRKLTLTHVALTLALHDITLIFPKLTHIIVQGPLGADAGWVSLPHFLVMAPNLVKLVYFQNDNITAAAMPLIEMPFLESVTTNFLALSNSFVTSFSAGRVNAPNLRKVSLVSDGQDASVPLGNLLAANPTIRTLHMQGEFDPVSPTGAHILFRDAPPLHTLVVSRASRKFIEALSAADENHSPMALPFLSCLKIECTRAWSANMTWTEFETLFRSRCELNQDDGLTCIGAQQLKQLTLITHDVLTEKTRKAIGNRMKCIRHFESDRMLLFRWEAPPRER